MDSTSWQMLFSLVKPEKGAKCKLVLSLVMADALLEDNYWDAALALTDSFRLVPRQRAAQLGTNAESDMIIAFSDKDLAKCFEDPRVQRFMSQFISYLRNKAVAIRKIDDYRWGEEDDQRLLEFFVWLNEKLLKAKKEKVKELEIKFEECLIQSVGGLKKEQVESFLWQDTANNAVFATQMIVAKVMLGEKTPLAIWRDLNPEPK